MPPQDPFELMEPDDFEPTPRPAWMLPAALLCLLAVLLMLVISVGG